MDLLLLIAMDVKIIQIMGAVFIRTFCALLTEKPSTMSQENPASSLPQLWSGGSF